MINKSHSSKMKKPEFVELSFALPFYEIYFSDYWNDNSSPTIPLELLELCDCTNVELNTQFLYDEYVKLQDGQRDIFIFYSKSSKDIFLYIDLFKEDTDQVGMIIIEVRVKTIDKERIKRILEKLYFKSSIRSNFSEDYFIQKLNRVATDRIPFQKRIVKHYLNGQQIPKPVS